MPSVQRFASYSEFLAHVQDEPTYSRESWGDIKFKDSWAGTSYVDALRLASTGWDEGRKLVEAQSLTMANAYKISHGDYETRQITRSVSGFMPDVPSFLAGVPNDMFTFVSVPDVHPIVKVVVNMSISSGVDGREITTRGATVCALIDILESSGRRCEVILSHNVSTRSGSDNVVQHYITVKSAQDALQIDQLAFALAHPASLRRLIFRSDDLLPAEYRQQILCGDYGSSYGIPCDAPASEQGDIYVAKMHYNEYTNPENWIEAQLRRQGVIE